ncbi:MAG: sulfotransferase [Acidimicrobiia bacterium]|nr:sulfotransferase [Acidimicrobiia bacterium]
MRALARLGQPLRGPVSRRYPDPEELVARVTDRTGLTDFGPGEVLEPLDELLRPLRDDPTLTTIGLFAWPTMLGRLLATRLQIVDFVKAHPEIRDEELVRPVIITGMPRTGTTLLYNLLADVPGSRPLMGWESMDPMPHRRLSFRKVKYRWWVRFVNTTIPQLRAIHHLQSDGPDEGLEMMDRTLHSFNFMLYAYSYTDWLLERTHREMCDSWTLWRWQLQMLQAYGPQGFWLLKAPTFMGLFPTIDALLPNARYVMTHRDLHSAIPSAMSLVTVVGASMRYAGAQVPLPRFVDRMAEMANQTRKQIEQRPNVQVLYPELIEDPAEIVSTILTEFGEDVPADLRRRVTDYLARHPQHKHGKHDYRLERFGLVEDDLQPYAADYARDLGLDRFRAF